MKREINIFIFLFLLGMGLSQTNVENFGPYKWDWLKYESCMVPKKGECGPIRVENIQNMSDVTWILDLEKDCPVTKAKITVNTFRDDGKTSYNFLNYYLDKPCQHFVVGPFLVNTFNLKHTCTLEKGHYRVHVNNDELLNNFLGSSFFYGNYSYKVMLFTGEKKIICRIASLTIKKP